MKVAITGAHGTGKTTLLEAMEKRFLQAGRATVVAPEIPRMICEATGDPAFFRRGKNNLVKQAAILFGHASTEASFTRSDDRLLLVDRTVLDHWAYTVELAEGESTFEECRVAFEIFLKSHLATYDAIFLLRPEFAPIDDGTRENDPVFQAKIDELIVGYLHAWETSHIQLSGSLEKRLDEGAAAIDELWTVRK